MVTDVKRGAVPLCFIFVLEALVTVVAIILLFHLMGSTRGNACSISLEIYIEETGEKKQISPRNLGR